MLAKRIIVLFSLLTFSVQSYSQAIPNGNFEDWFNFSWFSDPINWNTNNAQVSCASIRFDTVSYNGDYGMKVRTYGCFGWAQTGFQFDSLLHPLYLNCFVRTNIVGVDTVLIRVELFNDTNIVDSGLWRNTSSISTYSNISVSISQSSATVNGARIYVRSGINSATSITVDSLYFSDTNANLSHKPLKNNIIWSVYPNPSDRYIYVKTDYNSNNTTSIQAFDISGREVQITILKFVNGFRIESKEKGLIILKINSDQNTVQKKVIFN